MRFDDIDEGVAGPKNCWPGYRKVGTKPGTGKNAGKRVNDCEKIKEGLTDEVDSADVGEYDREGDMAQSQLKTAEDAAAELRSILDADENLPEWVQSKITKAVDYLDTARDYMKSEKQGVAEVSKSTLDQYVTKASDAHGHADFSARMSKDDPTKRSYHKDQKRTAEKRRQGISRALDRMSRTEGMAENNSALGQAVKEAGWGRSYSSYHDELSSRERGEQDAMDYSKQAFKRAELQHELGHEDDPDFERKQRQQAMDRDRGPWYIRIDGKIYRQKGQPKSFDWKRGANNYALAMLKNNPSLQGRILLSKSAEDK